VITLVAGLRTYPVYSLTMACSRSQSSLSFYWQRGLQPRRRNARCCRRRAVGWMLGCAVSQRGDEMRKPGDNQIQVQFIVLDVSNSLLRHPFLLRIGDTVSGSLSDMSTWLIHKEEFCAFTRPAREPGRL